MKNSKITFRQFSGFKPQNLFYLLIILCSNSLFSSERALYVDDFNNILGSYNKETKLLEFAKKNNIHTLILYDLNKINKRFPLADRNKNEVLAKFISRAKKNYNIKEISASGETGDFFLKAIHPYNVSRKKASEKFDVYNLEYEYWHPTQSLNGGYYCETYLKNGALPCSRLGSFNYYIEALSIMKLLAAEESHPIKIEAYIGGFTKEEITKVSKYADRVLVHAYVLDPSKSFEYTKERLKLISEINSKIEISIIFSSEPKFMDSWLRKNDQPTAEKSFFKALNVNENHLNVALNFKGFTYYNYSFLKTTLNHYEKNNHAMQDTYKFKDY
jgi:hypothetical protein